MQRKLPAIKTEFRDSRGDLNSPFVADGLDEGTPVKETNRISIKYNPISGRKKLNTYEIIKELGRGEYGRVKLGYDAEQNMYVAIKLLNRKDKPRLGRSVSTSSEEKVHREIAILKKCSHPNIVRLLEVLDDESSRKIYLVFEYCAKGEIKWQKANGGPKLTREEARCVARDVALGLEYLHANGIIHRDIKPANLLISADDIVKISDFGVSFAVTGETNGHTELELTKTVGTPAFFSPELCVPTEFNDQGERITPPINDRVDVWAFGVTLYCLIYGELPFEADNEYELFSVITKCELEFPGDNDDGRFENDNESYAEADQDLLVANDLLRKLLTKDPNKRPSISEIKNHPWFCKYLTLQQRQSFLRSCPSNSIKVSNEDVNEAIQGVSIKSLIKKGLSRIAGHMKPKSRSRASSTTTLNKILDHKDSKESIDFSKILSRSRSRSLSSSNKSSTTNVSQERVTPTSPGQSRESTATPSPVGSKNHSSLSLSSSKLGLKSRSLIPESFKTTPNINKSGMSDVTLKGYTGVDNNAPKHQLFKSRDSDVICNDQVLDNSSERHLSDSRFDQSSGHHSHYSHQRVLDHESDQHSFASDTDHSLDSVKIPYHHIYYNSSEVDSLKPATSNISGHSKGSNRSTTSSKFQHTVPGSPKKIFQSKTSLDNSSFLDQSSASSDSSDEELMIVVGRDRGRPYMRNSSQPTLSRPDVLGEPVSQ